MAASPARRRELVAVATDVAFVVAFLVSVVAALLAALPVIELGPNSAFEIPELAPVGDYPGDPLVVDKTLLWPHASVAWTGGEVTSYTADWRFALPLVCVAVWLALAVRQSRGGAPASSSASDDTVTLPAVGR